MRDLISFSGTLAKHSQSIAQPRRLGRIGSLLRHLVHKRGVNPSPFRRTEGPGANLSGPFQQCDLGLFPAFSLPFSSSEKRACQWDLSLKVVAQLNDVVYVRLVFGDPLRVSHTQPGTEYDSLHSS